MGGRSNLYSLHLLSEGISWIYTVKVVTDALFEGDFATGLWFLAVNSRSIVCWVQEPLRCHNPRVVVLCSSGFFPCPSTQWAGTSLCPTSMETTAGGCSISLAPSDVHHFAVSQDRFHNSLTSLKLNTRTAPAVPVAWTISPSACQVCSNSMRRQCCPSLSTDPHKTNPLSYEGSRIPGLEGQT